MNVPEDLLYTETHEWIKREGETIRVGITDHAQKELGDIVYVDLPKVGTPAEKGKTLGSVESVKAVSDLYSPVDGEVIAVHSDLTHKLETLASDPYNTGWMIKVAISDESSLKKLMDATAYEKQCASDG